MARDNFPKETIETLARRVNYRCSMPSCRKGTSGPRSDPARSVSVGVAAHITAAAPGGPRFDGRLTPKERRSAENGIWLCENHAKLVDNDIGRYSFEELRRWKIDAEAEALAELEGSPPAAAQRTVTAAAPVGPLKPFSERADDSARHALSNREQSRPSFRGGLQPQPQGGSFVHGRTGIDLVRINAGTFTMGSPPGEGDSDERPQRHVQVSDFYLGRYPVTNWQYDQFLKANPDSSAPRLWETMPAHSNQPVVGISLHDASAFAEWAGLRLPTEEEWEYACRAGTDTRYSSGNEVGDLEKVGWYLGNASSTVDVGVKPPNGFDLHDMHGNVREWCATEYWGYASPVLPSLDHESLVRLSREFDSFRLRAVVRGGAWNNGAASARSAARHWVRASRRDTTIGFRVARDF